jgi:aryl-alcohol dehydrogenase-like predicted oxidoreductase
MRDKVITASKVGYSLPSRRKWVSRVKPLVRPIIKKLGLKRSQLPSGFGGALSQNFEPTYIIQAVEQSLKRLKTDYLDLYQLHSPPAEVIRKGEFLPVLEKLKQQGKIRYYGIACDTVDDALVALQYNTISSVQMPINLLDQEALDEALPKAATANIAVIARGCYGGGFLAKPMAELNLEELANNAVERERKERAIAFYDQFALNQGQKLPELALHFVLAQPQVTVTLLGMRTQQHLASNLQHLASKKLTNAELQLIREHSYLSKGRAQSLPN